MDYLRGSFSVGAPGTKAYRDNWDKIDWGKGSKSAAPKKGRSARRRDGKRTK